MRGNGDFLEMGSPRISAVGRMYLHSALVASIKLALLRDFYQVQWMHVPEVTLHHPAIPRLPLASRVRAGKSTGV
jgi:hypothetical protein